MERHVLRTRETATRADLACGRAAGSTSSNSSNREREISNQKIRIQMIKRIVSGDGKVVRRYSRRRQSFHQSTSPVLPKALLCKRSSAAAGRRTAAPADHQVHQTWICIRTPSHPPAAAPGDRRLAASCEDEERAQSARPRVKSGNGASFQDRERERESRQAECEQSIRESEQLARKGQVTHSWCIRVRKTSEARQRTCSWLATHSPAIALITFRIKRSSEDIIPDVKSSFSRRWAVISCE